MRSPTFFFLFVKFVQIINVNIYKCYCKQITTTTSCRIMLREQGAKRNAYTSFWGRDTKGRSDATPSEGAAKATRCL